MASKLSKEKFNEAVLQLGNILDELHKDAPESISTILVVSNEGDTRMFLKGESEEYLRYLIYRQIDEITKSDIQVVKTIPPNLVATDLVSGEAGSISIQ